MLSLLLTLAVIGFVVWLITQIPMPAPFHNVIIGLAILALIVYVLRYSGLVTGVHPGL